MCEDHRRSHVQNSRVCGVSFQRNFYLGLVVATLRLRIGEDDSHIGWGGMRCAPKPGHIEVMF